MVVLMKRKCRHIDQGVSYDECDRKIKRRCCQGNQRVSDYAYMCLRCGDAFQNRYEASRHGDKPPHHIFFDLREKNALCTKCKVTRTTDTDPNHMGVLVENSPTISRISNELIAPIIERETDSYMETCETDEDASQDYDVIDAHLSKKLDVVNPSKVYGIPNIGNSCFLNCILQLLAHTPDFMEKIHSSEENPNFAFYLKEILNAIRYGTVDSRRISKRQEKHYLNSKDNLVRPNRIYGYIIDRAPQLGGYSQQDAHELFVEVLRNLEEDDNPKNKSIAADVFSSQILRLVNCMHCNDTRRNTEDCPVISLDVSMKTVPLPTMMQRSQTTVNFLVNEENGYHCEQCCTPKKNVRRDGKMTEVFSRAPPTLALHFKRFQTSMNGQGGMSLQKINTPVQLPDIYQFGGAEYTLYGILVHNGKEVDRGHYVCYLRPWDPMSRTHSCDWWYASDEKVMPVESAAVVRAGAYMAFYQRNDSM